MIKAITETTVAILLLAVMLGSFAIVFCDQIPNTPKINTVEYR